MRILKPLLRKKRKKESWFKYIMSVLHLWLGLLSSIIVFIVCLTGSIYTFKNQIIDLYNYDKVYVEDESQNLFPLDSLEALFLQKGKKINLITIPRESNKSLYVSYTEVSSNIQGSYYVNPYTGEILGTGDYSLERFFSFILDVHKTLLMSETGKQIVGIAILIFVFMLLSGLILWWPKKWKQLKNAVKIKWKARFYRLNYDLHNVLGFYFMLLLLFISITGLYITYPWVKSGIIVALGGVPVLSSTSNENTDKELSNNFSALLEEMIVKENEKEALKDEKTVSISKIILLANEKLNYKSSTIIKLPTNEEPRFIVKKINRENWLKALLPDIISFDKKGELKKVELFKDKPLNKQFVEISLPLHTGEIIGLPSLILYFIASLVGCLLPVTGFIIWWKKVT